MIAAFPVFCRLVYVYSGKRVIRSTFRPKRTKLSLVLQCTVEVVVKVLDKLYILYIYKKITSVQLPFMLGSVRFLNKRSIAMIERTDERPAGGVHSVSSLSPSIRREGRRENLSGRTGGAGIITLDLRAGGSSPGSQCRTAA